MMKVLVALASLAVACAGRSMPHEYYEKLFFEHIEKHQLKLADGAEYLKRIDIFASNIDLIASHNADTQQTFQMGANQFTHLTADEFAQMVRVDGARRPKLRKAASILNAEADPVLPSKVDYRQVSNGHTPVGDQGLCGSSWAFSALGAIYGAYTRQFNNAQPYLSTQQLVSCATAPNDGCNGGWMVDAYDWVMANGGLTEDHDYRYTSGVSGVTGDCLTNHTIVEGTAPVNYTNVAPNVKALMTAIVPRAVAIAVQADSQSFQFYRSGVLSADCGQDLNHGMVLAGYDTEKSTGLDYWIVQNSWGNHWGNAGYMYILRSDANVCGVLSAASYVTYPNPPLSRSLSPF